tara:strand:+ start:1027 stop:1776 length:750 start_codon:yes stop_codon:yes gene_type:complete
MMLIPLFDYEKHRIIMESSFIFKGEDYLYFPNGIEFYTLYRTTRKINSFSELEYIAEKFLYLNPDFDINLMKSLFAFISERDSGHIVRTYGSQRVNNMIDRVRIKNKKPYCARMRKIIFNPSKMIDKKIKMQIVGSVIGSKEKPNKEKIDEVIEVLWLDKEKVTLKKVAEKLQTTRHLVKWYFNDETKSAIKKINHEIRDYHLMARAMTTLSHMKDSGIDFKMRKLKQLSSIRKYSLLKEAVSIFQNDE